MAVAEADEQVTCTGCVGEIQKLEKEDGEGGTCSGNGCHKWECHTF